MEAIPAESRDLVTKALRGGQGTVPSAAAPPLGAAQGYSQKLSSTGALLLLSMRGTDRALSSVSAPPGGSPCLGKAWPAPDFGEQDNLVLLLLLL